MQLGNLLTLVQNIAVLRFSMVHYYYYCQFFENQSGEKGKIIQSFFFGSCDQRLFEPFFFLVSNLEKYVVSKQERFKIGLANINFMPTIFKIMQFSFDALLPNSINTLVQIRLKLILNFQYISSSMRLLYSYNEGI